MDKLKEMTNGEKLMTGGAIVLLLLSFPRWFEACVDFSVIGGGKTCAGHNGWSNFLSLLGILLAVALAVVIVLRRTGAANLPEKLGNLAWNQVYMIAGIAVFALILLQTLVGDSGADRTLWLWLAVVVSAAIGAGGYLSMQENKSAL